MQEPNPYKESFLGEARVNLAMMNAALVRIEGSPGTLEPLNDIFRVAHTFKGMAAMMGLARTADLCHALEDALDALRKGRTTVEECADTLFRAFDSLEEALQAVERNEPEPDMSELVRRLRAIAAADAARPAVPGPRGGPAAVPSKAESLPVKIERLDLLMNMAEEMIVVKMRFDRLRGTLRHPELSAAVDALDRLVSELQYQVIQARMLPIKNVFDRFPRLVRDLAKQQKKEVLFKQDDGGIELDRIVSDEIGESLVHLLRNAVDHGIEAPEERERRGKPSRGTVRISAARTKDAAVIEVEDDGAGLDLEGIRQAAARRGLPPQTSAGEIMEAIIPGVSTTREATTVSGRGLGLDIVKRKMQSLGGTLSVTTRPGGGTSFRMEIPLTLAVLKTLLVEVGGRSYAVPLSGIERIAAVDEVRVKGVLGGEALILDAQDVPLLRLRALFQLPPVDSARFPVVVVGRGRRKLGLAVDALVAAQEIVLKPLNSALRGSHFAGSAIIGTGEAILVLDVAGLIRQWPPAASA